MSENYKKICVSCREEIKDKDKDCECGGRTIAFGNITTTEESVTCICGGTTFDKTAHMDFTDRYSDTLQCQKCNNQIGLETKRDEDDMLW